MIEIFWSQVSTKNCDRKVSILIVTDVWFHRYEDDGHGGKKDIEGRCRSQLSWCPVSTLIFISRLQLVDRIGEGAETG